MTSDKNPLPMSVGCGGDRKQGVRGVAAEAAALAPSGSSRSASRAEPPAANAGQVEGEFWDRVAAASDDLFGDMIRRGSIERRLTRAGVVPAAMDDTIEYLIGYLPPIGEELVAKLLREAVITKATGAA